MLESRLVKLVVGCSFFWAGCGKPGELAVTPETIDWGEVDFQGWPSDMDEGGYQQTEVAITNLGETDLDVIIQTVDFDHLCIEGFSVAPIAPPTLTPGTGYAFFVGVCAYSSEDGERDQLVSGSLDFSAEGLDESLSIPWQFTPVRNMGGSDTGDDDTGR